MKAHELLIYTKTGCHLCEEMKAILEHVRSDVPFELNEVDVTSDPELEARFGQEIPVLFVNGRKAFKFRTTERKVRLRLRQDGSEPAVL